MSYTDEIKTPYRWYDREERMIKYRPYCKVECKYKLYTPPNRFLPFMILRDQSNDPLTSWKIYDEDDVLVTEVSLSNIEKKTFNGKDYFIYYGEEIAYMWLDCGFYRAEITDGTNTFYSEEFFVFQSSREDIIFQQVGITSDTDFPVSNGQAGDTILVRLNIANFTLGTVVIILAGQSYSFYANGDYEIALTADAPYTDFTIAISDGAGVTVRTIERVLFDPDCYTVLQWTNTCDIGNTYYAGGYTNILYFPREVELGRSDDRLVEEGKENGERQFQATFQRLAITMRMETGLLPGYVWESLFGLRLHSDISVILSEGRGTMTLREPVIQSTYEFTQCYANGEIAFVIDEVIKTGCCDDLEECDNPELIRNGDFNLQGTYWNFAGNAALGGFIYSSGKAVTTGDTNGTGFSQLITGVTPGMWYSIKFTAEVTTGALFVTFCSSDDRTGGFVSVKITTSGEKEILLPGTDNGGGSIYVHFWGDSDPDVMSENYYHGSVDNISIRERCFQPPLIEADECLYKGELCDIFDLPPGTEWSSLIIDDGDTEDFADVPLLNIDDLVTALETFVSAGNVTIEWNGNCITIWVVGVPDYFNGTTDGIVITKYQPAPTEQTVVMTEIYCI